MSTSPPSLNAVGGKVNSTMLPSTHSRSSPMTHRTKKIDGFALRTSLIKPRQKKSNPMPTTRTIHGFEIPIQAETSGAKTRAVQALIPLNRALAVNACFKFCMIECYWAKASARCFKALFIASKARWVSFPIIPKIIEESTPVNTSACIRRVLPSAWGTS